MSTLQQVDMQLVASSNVESVGYDEKYKTVYVKFLDGSEYCYRDVAQNEFEALRDAPSVGSYLHRNFKGVYVYERIG